MKDKLLRGETHSCRDELVTGGAPVVPVQFKGLMLQHDLLCSGAHRPGLHGAPRMSHGLPEGSLEPDQIAFFKWT